MSPRPRPLGRAGFSLLEVMIALIVLSLVMGSAVALLRSQTRGFAQGADRTDLYQNGRYIVTTLERIIRTEGAGVAGTQPMIVYADGNTVIFERRFRGTLVNGRSYDNDYCFIFEMAGSRVRRIREYMDTRKGYAQIFGSNAAPPVATP